MKEKLTLIEELDNLSIAVRKLKDEFNKTYLFVKIRELSNWIIKV